MRTATYLGKAAGSWRGDARWYRLSEPARVRYGDESDASTEYVIVSAAVAPYTGPETYIFPADADGKITSWGEMDGSFRGGLDHDRALRNAGYRINE